MMEPSDLVVDDANAWLELCQLLVADEPAPEDIARDARLGAAVREAWHNAPDDNEDECKGMLFDAIFAALEAERDE